MVGKIADYVILGIAVAVVAASLVRDQMYQPIVVMLVLVLWRTAPWSRLIRARLPGGDYEFAEDRDRAIEQGISKALEEVREGSRRQHSTEQVEQALRAVFAQTFDRALAIARGRRVRPLTPDTLVRGLHKECGDRAIATWDLYKLRFSRDHTWGDVVAAREAAETAGLVVVDRPDPTRRRTHEVVWLTEKGLELAVSGD